ncbi:group II intron maturase-specific domain-containing protein [Egibacter rhizosphaerae]|uniref:group II intron maturase-specific domain-containing protein n=1 Tax=Egibacter rhizosphaerae TaxID=1670831 RepID=UPI003B837B91
MRDLNRFLRGWAEYFRYGNSLGLRPKASKTVIVHLHEGGEGLDFLGFHHRWVRAKSRRNRHVCFSSPAVPRTRPCSTPATVFVSSRSGGSDRRSESNTRACSASWRLRHITT